MSAINIEAIADYFETLLTGGVTPILSPKLFAADGKRYDSKNYPIYVEEVIGYVDETPTLARNHATLATITYNVISKTSMPDTREKAEELRGEIMALFNEACLPEIVGVNFTYILPQRRTSTLNEKGSYRNAPVDITFKVAGLEY